MDIYWTQLFVNAINTNWVIQQPHPLWRGLAFSGTSWCRDLWRRWSWYPSQCPRNARPSDAGGSVAGRAWCTCSYRSSCKRFLRTPMGIHTRASQLSPKKTRQTSEMPNLFLLLLRLHLAPLDFLSLLVVLPGALSTPEKVVAPDADFPGLALEYSKYWS